MNVSSKSYLYMGKEIYDGGLISKPCPTLVTPWTEALQAPISMRFPSKNTGAGCFPYSGDLPGPGIEPRVSCIASNEMYVGK